MVSIKNGRLKILKHFNNPEKKNSFVWYWYLDKGKIFSYNVNTESSKPYLEKMDRGKLKINSYSIEWSWYAGGIINGTVVKILDRKDLTAETTEYFSDGSSGKDGKWQCRKSKI